MAKISLSWLKTKLIFGTCRHTRARVQFVFRFILCARKWGVESVSLPLFFSPFLSLSLILFSVLLSFYFSLLFSLWTYLCVSLSLCLFLSCSILNLLNSLHFIFRSSSLSYSFPIYLSSALSHSLSFFLSLFHSLPFHPSFPSHFYRKNHPLPAHTKLHGDRSGCGSPSPSLSFRFIHLLRLQCTTDEEWEIELHQHTHLHTHTHTRTITHTPRQRSGLSHHLKTPQHAMQFYLRVSQP